MVQVSYSLDWVRSGLTTVQVRYSLYLLQFRLGKVLVSYGFG